jgi:hypothetical protein
LKHVTGTFRDKNGLKWLIIVFAQDIEIDVAGMYRDTNGLNWLIIDSV